VISVIGMSMPFISALLQQIKQTIEQGCKTVEVSIIM